MKSVIVCLLTASLEVPSKDRRTLAYISDVYFILLITEPSRALKYLPDS
jgi:hypothetical protein